MTETVPASPTSAQPKSVWWLALRVFDEPTQVFTELAARPRALLPVLLIILASIGSSFSVPAAVLTNAAEQQLNTIEQKRPGTITPERRERAMGNVTSVSGRAGAAASASLITLVVLLVAAGILTGVFNAISGGGIRFKEEWAIATHAFLPQIIGLMITWVGISLTGDPQFRMGLGFLVSEDTSRYLHNFAAQFTFFGAWNVYLLALGNQVRTREASIGMPQGIVAGLWVVANLAAAGFATAMASLIG
ncbi:MAG: YIP1 family protein [Gemmatimonadetes bacterium]|nr:YIP1 family protein [Gemmatimonadota bacterium]